jgi:hypothetical protein
MPFFLTISFADAKLDVEINVDVAYCLFFVNGVGGIAVGETGMPAPTVLFTIGFRSVRITVAPVDMLLACSKNSSCFCTLTSSKGQLSVAINAPLTDPAVVEINMVENKVSLSMG